MVPPGPKVTRFSGRTVFGLIPGGYSFFGQISGSQNQQADCHDKYLGQAWPLMVHAPVHLQRK